MKDLIITYLHHSGFSAALGRLLLVFDYYPGEHEPGSAGILTRGDFIPYDQVTVFVSHSHADHFDPTIYDWAEPGKVSYVLSEDVPGEYEGHRMKPGDSLTLGEVEVTAFDSTDLGVSYLVKIPGYTLFHAGDLNFWHWRDESTLHEIEQAEHDFYQALKPLEGVHIDVAFFPVDPRQGSMYDAGANSFVLAIKPRVLIPMHWQGRKDVAQDFARRNKTRLTDMVALTERGESVHIYDRSAGITGQPVWHHQLLAQAILQQRKAAGQPEGEAPVPAEEEKHPETEE